MNSRTNQTEGHLEATTNRSWWLRRRAWPKSYI